MDPSVALILVTTSFIGGAILGAIYGLRTGDRIIKMHQETVSTFIAMLLANGWQYDDEDTDESDKLEGEGESRLTPKVVPFRNRPEGDHDKKTIDDDDNIA